MAKPLVLGEASTDFAQEALPVAAAVDLVGSEKGRVVVFDFGGGTLDITVADLRDDSVGILSNVGLELGGFHLDEDLAQARVRGHFGHGRRVVSGVRHQGVSADPAGKELQQ